MFGWTKNAEQNVRVMRQNAIGTDGERSSRRSQNTAAEMAATTEIGAKNTRPVRGENRSWSSTLGTKLMWD